MDLHHSPQHLPGLEEEKSFQTLPLKEEIIKSRHGSPEQIMLEKHIHQKNKEFMRNLPEDESQIAYMRFYAQLNIKSTL